LIRRTHIFLLLLLAPVITTVAQDNLYDAGVVQEIRISFTEKNWRYILDSLFRTVGDNGKLRGDVTINGTTIAGAGIRYKGYSSYNANEIKNPFNIDLDYSVVNRNYRGHVKLKLSNVIQDPSFVREVLSYELARKYLPASRANFANLYVNDTLIGLYTNVEAVDANFTRRFWNSHNNTFFKGEPVKLQYPFGQNANLALTHGSDSSGYLTYYNMESATGWDDLYTLIYRLDKGADSVQSILNIDRALWMHAFNEVFLNLDSYIGYSQNYYMYRDDNGQFNPIFWDMNMSFGSFRDSDGSTHFQGVSIPQMKALDPLALMDFAVSPRPFMTRLFANDTLKKMYFAHMRTLADENIRNGLYYSRAQELQSLIDADVLRDTNRFYSYDDFHANLNVTVGGTGSMNQYPGLKDLMEARLVYLDSLQGFSGQPQISLVSHFPETPEQDQPCWITARITGSTMVMLEYRFTSGGIFTTTGMFDDGNHHDGAAGDGVFGAMIVTGGHTIQYYLYAQNDLAGIFSPERAAYEFYSIQPLIRKGDIVLNEFLLTGNTGESWIELLNTTAEPFRVNGMTIGSNLAPGGIFLPDTTILPRKYLVLHVGNLKNRYLDPTMQEITPDKGNFWLVNSAGTTIDSLSYGQQVVGKSIGRYPNGYGSLTYMKPSPNGYNNMGTTPETGFLLYPNPASTLVNIELKTSTPGVEVSLFNALGKIIFRNQPIQGDNLTGSRVIPLDISDLSSGIYLVKVSVDGTSATKKLIID